MGLMIRSGKRNMLLDCLQLIHTPPQPGCHELSFALSQPCPIRGDRAILSDEYIQVSRGMSDAAGCPLVAQMSVDRCLPQTPSWVTFPVRMPFIIPACLQFRSSRFKAC